MNKRIENYNSKFKSKYSDKDVAEVVAFLNSRDGGYLYIGIKDNGDILGVENTDELVLKITNQLNDSISPSILGLFDVVTERQDDKFYIKIIIASGAEKPYYIKKYGQSEKGCYIRVGNAKKPMTTSMIEEMYSKRTRHSLGKISSPRNDLTFNQLRIFYEGKKFGITEMFLKNLELYNKDDEFNYNAYLLADNNSISIKVAVYSGTNKVDLIESNEYGYCSLIKAANSVLDKLNIHNATHTRITGNAQRDQWRDIDKDALREAVINAFVHNDYATNEVPPVFEIFSDRLVITSMGGLPFGMTEEEFFEGVSNPRNKVLMRVFKDMDLVEQLGSGMERILAVYDKSIFKISANYIKVTFVFGDKTAISGDKTAIILDQKEAILNYAKENSQFRSKDIQELLNLGSSRVRKILSEMCEEKLIDKHGVNKGTYYTRR
jgi:predicted HTH transcriptional regulator